MRHFLLFGPVSALALRVGHAPARAGLVTPAGGAQRQAPRLIGARARAVALAPVAVAANEHGRAAARAQVTACGQFHGISGPWGLDGASRFVKYLAGNTPVWAWGAASVRTWSFGPVSRLL
ncbi:MAG: hypothetical protein LBE78_08815 [Burkholderiaceae bacterium]|nr:hypothetical protein [Burkholderiaceae bacterium]